MWEIVINIHQQAVLVRSPSFDVIERVKKDFEYFIDKKTPSIYLTIEANRTLPDLSCLKNRRGRQTANCRVYEFDGFRWNVYRDDVAVQFWFQENRGVIFSEDLDALHELVYLLILSRVGKKLDQQGLHRLHAMAVEVKNRTLICSMHMGHGKTTLMLDLLSSIDTMTWLSDDSPIVDHKGQVLPFPLRVGVTEDWLANKSPQLSNVDFKDLYSIKRIKYGLKYLLPPSAVQNPIGKGGLNSNIFIFGKRQSDRCQLQKISGLFAIPTLFLNLAVGLGLPMMREYYFEPGLKDKFRIVAICLRRFVACVNLMRHSKFYYLSLSNNRRENSKVLESFLRTTMTPQ
jgi:hypothetical protein